MQSRNPIFSRDDAFVPAGSAAFGTAPPPADVSPQQLEEMYARPAGGPAGLAMTIDDVVIKTAGMFVILLATAVPSFLYLAENTLVVFGAAIVAFILGMVIAVKRSTNPGLIMVYAAIEGVFVGGISAWYQAFADGVNIVGQAVLGTLVAFSVMLALYKSGRLRATPQFKKMMMIAMVSYLIIAMASLVSSFFGVGEGWGFYGVSGVGLLLCGLGVALASFSLVLDFDAIEKGVQMGVPAKEAWRAGFGLMVTLVWLYLELLRMLAILQGRD